jgi:hypothetical protein
MPILGIMASAMSANLWQPEGAYDSLATITVGATSVASITFTGIPSTYKHLQIRGIARGSRPTYGNDNLNIQFNLDTGSNYSWHKLQGNGSAASAGGAANATRMTANALAGSGAPTNTFSAHILDILDYADTNKNKTLRGLDGVDINGTVAGEGGVIELHSGNWRNTAAITSITLFAGDPNFVQYTTFALYGVK